MSKRLGLFKNKFLARFGDAPGRALLNAAGNFVSAALLAHVLGAKVQGQFYVAVSLYSFLWFLVNQGTRAGDGQPGRRGELASGRP
jgi:hypothetical protein